MSVSLQAIAGKRWLAGIPALKLRSPVVLNLRAYGLAGLLIGAAFLLRLWLDRYWHDEFPYPIFFLALVFVVRFTGLGPSIVSVVASFLLADYFFIQPRYNLGLEGPSQWMGWLSFLLASSALVYFSTRGRQAARRERQGKSALEQKAADLQANEEFNRRLLNSSADCIQLLDLAGDVLAMNEAGRRLFEVDSVSGFINRPWAECWPEPGRDAIRNALVHAREGKPVSFCAAGPSVRGTPRAWDVVLTPICDPQGRPERLLAISREVTALKRAERRTELLAKTAARLLRSKTPQQVVESLCREVMEFLDCDVFFNFLVDAAGGFLRLNACAGIPAETARQIQVLQYGVAVCGCAARDACRIIAEDVLHKPDPRTELIKSFGIQAYACHPLIIEDRVLGTLSFGTRNRTRFNDEELSLMKAVADLVAIAMERQRNQAELQTINAQLEQRVAERTRSLEEATEQLNAFCHSVAHDLRAPLRTQLCFTRLLIDDYGSKLDHTGRDYARRVIQSAERQSNIIQDLLAHLSLSRAELPLEKVELRPAIEQARADLALDMQQNEAELDVRQVGAAGVTANRSSLHLVLTNLLSNAFKFVPAEVQPKVCLRTETRNGAVRLWVEDNGIGIEPEHLGKLFGLFQRLNRGEKYPGTGMGLANVKKAVERMGGRVGVESTVGQGSRFWFELPAA